MTVAIARNALGVKYLIHNVAINSAGVSTTVSNSAENSAGNPFLIFTDTVELSAPVGQVFIVEDDRTFWG
jgi:hypothetical protein